MKTGIPPETFPEPDDSRLLRPRLTSRIPVCNFSSNIRQKSRNIFVLGSDYSPKAIIVCNRARYLRKRMMEQHHITATLFISAEERAQLVHYCAALSGTSEVAEDLAQETAVGSVAERAGAP